jgi:hypothetical protein
MEFTLSGNLFTSPNDLIEVKLFENLPFDTEYTVYANWVAEDIISVLKDEGLLKLDGLFKIHYVKMEKQHLYDLNGGGDVLKTKLQTTYNVSLTYSLEGAGIAGSNHQIDDMEMKIRDKKLIRLGL